MSKIFAFKNTGAEEERKNEEYNEILERQAEAIQKVSSSKNDNDQGGKEIAGHSQTKAANISAQLPIEEMSVITKNVTVSGNLNSTSPMRIFGRVDGDIRCESELTIGNEINGNIYADRLQLLQGKINGNIECKNDIVLKNESIVTGNVTGGELSCNGRIEGNTNVSGKVVMLSNAIVMGDISSNKISIEEGAVINGLLKKIEAENIKKPISPEMKTGSDNNAAME